MCLFCQKVDLENESDVEQKLIAPMLTNPTLGLGYLTSDFRTKKDIRKILIDKGISKKLYLPDYIIVLNGLPLLIIEAKAPGENLDEALREARLYATEINSRFPAGINPCHKIIVTNGHELIATLWDTVESKTELSFEDVDISNIKYNNLIEFVGKRSISEYCNQIYKTVRKKRDFIKPVNVLGGKAVANEELAQNSFGTSLALDYRHLFNPTTTEDRINVVKNAYVSSKKHLKHVSPIDKIIRATKPPSITDSQDLQDTRKPRELISKFIDRNRLKGELLLLIGNVGAGKSTFVDYLKEIALPESTKESTLWITIDFNEAPLSRDEIYKWIKEKLILKLKASDSETDFDELETLKKFYRPDLRKTEKGPAAIFDRNSENYKKIIADKLLELQNDPSVTLQSLIKYLCKDRGKLLVVVLDNCDKRNRDDQLLMFDVAKWLKKECECLVFLPLRDTTYDHHRKEPPLDTAVKDLVFRIEPPLLMDVLYARLHYAQREDKREKSYNLPNGMRVKYRPSERDIYLQCIIRSLFQNDPFFKSLVTGIAGRDIRKGIEIFLDFCKSGHICESEILKIKQSNGDYSIPSYIVTRVLLRGNRRYFNDESSNIKNLFSSYKEDGVPDPLVRVDILDWLKTKFTIPGPNKIKGYHKLSELIKDLIPFGHDESRIRSEVIKLLKAGCILSESQADDSVTDDDLISISPSGHVHLDLLANLDYLASCSEDTFYDLRRAETIAHRVTGRERSGHLSRKTTIENAGTLLDYLSEYKQSLLSRPGVYLSDESSKKTSFLERSLLIVESAKKSLPPEQNVDELKRNYPNGTIIQGQVVSVQKYGVFIEFGSNITGLIHISKFSHNKSGELLFKDIDAGDEIEAKIIGYSEEHEKFDLEPVQTN